MKNGGILDEKIQKNFKKIKFIFKISIVKEEIIMYNIGIVKKCTFIYTEVKRLD